MTTNVTTALNYMDQRGQLFMSRFKGHIPNRNYKAKFAEHLVELQTAKPKQ